MKKGVPMPETREWPPYLRRAAKLCLLTIYLGNAVAGGLVVYPLSGGRPLWALVLAVVVVAAATTGAVLMLLERWMEERAAANLTGLLLAIYAVLNTIAIATSGASPSGTALIYVATAAVGLRAVHLSAFDFNLHGAQRRAREARA